ncbi:MAG: phospholipase D-like domain-containing protein [Opitutaceae bacterium]|nr:phospholipase D-like domain-containing protein [Opitutaceae bacterium]
MSRLVRWIFALLAGTACVLGGISLSMLVADRQLTKPSKDFAFAADLLEHDGYGALARLIGGARSEVLISARQLTSRAVLDALKAASDRGITVRIILDPGSNPDPAASALGFLMQNHVGRVLISSRPLYDQFAVIDRETIVTTAAPWSAVAARDLASIVLLRHRGAGAIMRKHFDILAGDARPAHG